MNIKRLNDDLYMKSKVNDENTVMEYFNNDDKRHCENGPALISLPNMSSTSSNSQFKYLEWWENGKLVAIFDEKLGVMKKTNNDTFTGLYDVELPEKWKGLEVTLSLHDLQFCNKPTLPYDGSLPPTIALADALLDPSLNSINKHEQVKKTTENNSRPLHEELDYNDPKYANSHYGEYALIDGQTVKVNVINDKIEQIRKKAFPQSQNQNSNKPE